MGGAPLGLAGRHAACDATPNGMGPQSPILLVTMPTGQCILHEKGLSNAPTSRIVDWGHGFGPLKVWGTSAPAVFQVYTCTSNTYIYRIPLFLPIFGGGDYSSRVMLYINQTPAL